MQKINRPIAGFTLIELMMTLAIMGIVLTIGVPSMQSMITNNRLTTITNNVNGAFNIARSEAIKRNKRVVVRKTGSVWKDGWEVFVDLNADNDKDTGEEVVQKFEALANNILINVPVAYTNYISFRPDGRSNTNGSFYICSSIEARFRRIIISASGRIRTETQDTSSKVYADEC